MIEAVFLTAIGAGGIAALAGKRSAVALLTGTAFTAGLAASGVPFLLPVWMLVDLVVIAVIIHPKMDWRDCAIMALFYPLWATYFVDGQAAWTISALVSSVQLLLTFPVYRAAESGRRLLRFIKKDGGGMAFAAAGGR